jgi:hypothetical protein
MRRTFSMRRAAALANCWLLLSAPGLLVPGAAANVNLELRPATEPCATTTVLVDLYAVSDDDTFQSIAAMDVVLHWDPAILQLVPPAGSPPPFAIRAGFNGLAETAATGDDIQLVPVGDPVPPGFDHVVWAGPDGVLDSTPSGDDQFYGWLQRGFPPDPLGGLNEDLTDGEGLFIAWAQFGGAAYASPDGFLVARLEFEKVESLGGVATDVLIVPEVVVEGIIIDTIVYDGDIGGLEVTGTLTSAEAFVPGPIRGDLNCDGAIDGFDIDPFVLALADAAGYAAAYPGCDRLLADVNCDGAVNGFDIDPFVLVLAGP